MNADRFFWQASIIALCLLIGEMLAISYQREKSHIEQHPAIDKSINYR